MYKQISEQIKHAIATNQIQLGSRLPTVRQLAQDLGINPGTVARAYLELEQEQIVFSRLGSGITVTANSNDPAISRIRQRRLSILESDHILKALSLGYSPDELEAAFSTHLSRWREERCTNEQVSASQLPNTRSTNSIKVAASHDLALNILINRLKETRPEVSVELTYAGSLGGLIALQEGRADFAGIHLLDQETGEYNYPYLKHLLPGRALAVVNLVYRIQGLMVARNNPKLINSLHDLKRADVTFVNRQGGSGTRILLDFELRKHGINPSEVKGYEHELDTHTAVATIVSRGEADVGLGIEAAADALELDFLPILKEKYDLVIPIEKYRSELISLLMEIIASTGFKSTVDTLGGYDTTRTGSVTFLE